MVPSVALTWCEDWDCDAAVAECSWGRDSVDSVCQTPDGTKHPRMQRADFVFPQSVIGLRFLTEGELSHGG